MAGAPVKILHVVFSLEPGGMENGLINVARALDPGEFEVHVCCLERPGAFAERLPEPRRIHVLGKQPGFSPLTAWRLARLIAKIESAIIHSHNLRAVDLQRTGRPAGRGASARAGGACRN